MVKVNKKYNNYVLFNCKNKEIISIHKHFEDRYCRYVKHFKTKLVSSKTLEILNVMPKYQTSEKDKANPLICTFVKNILITYYY